jgi:sugar phosphate isomerase/epimerase
MLLQRPLLDALDFARRAGLNGFEVWADHPHAHPDETPGDVRATLRRRLADFARVSVHGPLGNTSLASINPGIWRESVRQYVGAIELAHDIGAAVLVVHPGDLRDARFFADFMRLAEEALGRLARRAQELGVMLAVENCGPYHAGVDRTAADLRSLIKRTGSSSVGACLDIGHAAVNRNTDELVDLLGSDIVHLHVHDNHGQRDEHLPVGYGTIDFSPLLPILADFSGLAITEIVWDGTTSVETPEQMLRDAEAGWHAVRARSSSRRGVAPLDRPT